jgi:23S rRNA pseudouridine2605 synthase
MTDAPDAPPERIAKRLARAGVASRRDAERLIAEGRVRLNGRRLDTPAVTVTAADRIEVDGHEVDAPEPPRLWRYHKPEGLVTSARDEKGRPTVFDALPPDMPRVLSVGRLDIASEGLLLLTNDGELKRRLELPTTGWLRRYRARAHGAPSEAALDELRRGVTVDGERFQPMSVTLDRIQGANSWLTVGLREGRNREVRRALEHVGLTVNRLIRVSYGPFQLGDLPPGAVEEVKGRVLADQLGLPRPARPEPPAKAARAPEAAGKARPQKAAAPGGGPGKAGAAKPRAAKAGAPAAAGAGRPAAGGAPKPPRGGAPAGGGGRTGPTGRPGAGPRRPR